MNRDSERAAELVRCLPAMRAELEITDDEIKRLRRLLLTVDTPSAGISSYSNKVMSGTISDPTANTALRGESKASQELRDDIYKLEQQKKQLFHTIGEIESALTSLGERARLLIERLDIDGEDRESVLDEYRSFYGADESDRLIFLRRSAAYRQITKYLEGIL